MPSPPDDDPALARSAFAVITDQLAELRGMTVGDLRKRYVEVFGEPSRSRNKDYLRKKIQYRIQELVWGGLSERARDRIEELAADAPVRWRSPRKSNGKLGTDGLPPAGATAERDPRLPSPGTVLTREHGGVEHAVTVLADGFEYKGARFPTLSKVAREITGTNWNGFLFFRLDRRGRGGRG